MKLSIVIPCYNEEATLETCVRAVMNIADHETVLEVIIVDDCSRDKSREIAERLSVEFPNVKLLAHQVNQGKGAGLRTGFTAATGDVIVVQDADLEYNPQDLKRMLNIIREGKADVVLGSRFQGHDVRKVLFFWHTLANKGLTFLSNACTNLNVTDMETCYKMFTRAVRDRFTIEENRFGVEPEMVAKFARMRLEGVRRLRIYEIGIDYHGRTYEEGKKIGLKDAFRALVCIAKYSFRP